MVKSIYNSAFAYCTSLATLYIGSGHSSICRLVHSNALSHISYGAIIYVPSNLLSSYKTATNWIYVSSQIYGI